MGIYSKLEKLLKNQNMTIGQLAKISGVPDTTLYSMKSRDSNKTDLNVLKSLSDSLGVTINYFVDDGNEGSIKLSDEETLTIFKLRALDDHGVRIINTVMDCELERLNRPVELELNIAAKGNGQINKNVVVDINQLTNAISELDNK